MQNNIDQILQDPSSWGQYSPALQQALTQLSSNNTNASPQYNQRLSDSTIVGNGDTAVAQDPQNRLSVLMSPPPQAQAPQQQPMPQNYIQNNSTGAVTDVGPSYMESGRPQSATVNGIINFAQQNNIDPQMVPSMIKYQSSTPNSAPSVTDVYRQSFQSGIPFEQLLSSHMQVAQGNLANTSLRLKNQEARATIAQKQAQTNALTGGVAAGQPNPTIENNAQLIATGKVPPLSSFAMRTPFGQMVMSRVLEINPDYNGADYTINKNTENAFASGKQGNTIRSFNVALNHLDTLGGLADALQNGNIQLVNKIGNAYAAQTGGTAPTNFTTAKKIVGDEIVKAIVGAGGGVTDRQEAAKTINDAQSPEQLRQAIDTYKTLMSGQLQGLHQQYVAGGGRKDFNTFLTEQGKSQGESGSKTTTQAEVQATAAKYGVPVAKVIADAKAKGYTVQ